MNKTKVKCPACSKLTLLNQKKETLNDSDIIHYFFECDRCSHKETIYYSDSKLRQLIKQQQKAKSQITKNSLRKIIESRMHELRELYERKVTTD